MDTILLILGFVCAIIGIFGSFLPVLPGPIISWIGLVMLYLTEKVANNYWILGITLIIVLTISILDYTIPAKGTKKFGGSSYGIWGTNIGMLIGIFVPIPFGFIVGAFVGAFVGELFYNSQDKNRALKAATGSLLGFLASSFMKMVVCLCFLLLYVVVAFREFF
jgi:uncharacterized protein